MATTTTTSLGEVLNAADRGDVDCVRRWIDGGGDTNSACRGTVRTPSGADYHEGETPLMVAAMAGRLDVIRMLVQAGADVNITRPPVPDSELHESIGETQSALTLSLTHGRPNTWSRLGRCECHARYSQGSTP